MEAAFRHAGVCVAETAAADVLMAAGCRICAFRQAAGLAAAESDTIRTAAQRNGYAAVLGSRVLLGRRIAPCRHMPFPCCGFVFSLQHSATKSAGCFVALWHMYDRQGWPHCPFQHSPREVGRRFARCCGIWTIPLLRPIGRYGSGQAAGCAFRAAQSSLQPYAAAFLPHRYTLPPPFVRIAAAFGNAPCQGYRKCGRYSPKPPCAVWVSAARAVSAGAAAQSAAGPPCRRKSVPMCGRPCFCAGLQMARQAVVSA